MKHLIISLSSNKKKIADPQLVGGKGANLMKLHRFGFSTAPGFIITTRFFDQYMRAFLDRLFIDHKTYQAKTDNSKIASFLSDQLDIRIINKIQNYRDRIPGKVAVRSSMVGEDQAVASFAGQLDTFLDIDRDNLWPTVIKCFASSRKPGLEKYVTDRENYFRPNQDIMSIAVIIQQMVQAKTSGVVFTADPICGRREVIIEASEGNAQDLVSGKVNPDRYIVNARGKIEQSKPAINNSPLLNTDQILELAKISNQITYRMGFPQDIEWAWDGQSFIILQARPISNLKGKNIYSNKLMADMSPGLLKPLQWSTNTVAMTKNVFGRLFTEIIGRNDLDFTKSTRLIHSRLYANLTFFEVIFQEIGLPVNFFEMLTRDETGRRGKPKLSMRFIFLVLFRFIPFVLKYSRIRNEMGRFIDKQDRLLDAFRRQDWTTVAKEEKYRQLENLFKLHNDAQWSIIITGLNMTIRNTVMKKMVKKHAPSVEPSDLIRGLAGLKGLEPNNEMQGLSGALQKFPEEMIWTCMEEQSDIIRTKLSHSDSGLQLLNDFDKFMEKFGHLSANTTNFTESSWIENPEMIWSIIAKGALRANIPDETSDKILRIENKQAVLKEMSFLQKPIFLSLLNSTITYLDLREKISLLLSEDTYQIRRLLLNIGEDLIQNRYLENSSDIFFLYYEELVSVQKQTTDKATIKRHINERRKQYQTDETLTPDDTICGDDFFSRPGLIDTDSEFLAGICGSSGYKNGYAYVVKDPANVTKELSEDDILVVPFSHVGWTPLFANIGGIIAETGGQLSHTSIIAREYGIPAIVNVRQAMQSIETGQPLTLDADNGRVYLRHIVFKEGGSV